MISTLRGKVIAESENYLVVEVGGVGYSVATISHARAQANLGQEIFLYTSLIVREDAFTLFGYQTSGERDLFQLLQTVSGIGPKVSHAIISALSLAEIVDAISSGDSKTLEKVSGLGKKGAQRIILELKEKVTSFDVMPRTAGSSPSSQGISIAQALSGLGFNGKEIDHALEIVRESGATSIEEGLKIALAALHSGGARG